VKLLISMRHAGALRNFGSTVAELASRGHEIRLAFMSRKTTADDQLARDIASQYPSVTCEQVKIKTSHAWRDLVADVRAAADYLRYLAPEFRSAHALRARAEIHLPAKFRPVLTRRLVRATPVRVGLSLLRAGVERAVPPDPAIVDFVSQRNPDAVLVTPLVELGSAQIEYVKAAQALGVPSGLLVHSWDNLTNKGLIHVRPDRVFVWNDAQSREAVHLHGLSAAQVVVTGAPTYDQWFGRGPAATRETFCRTVGLPAGTPFFLYVCSSRFIAPHEDDFVRTWIRALRSAPDPVVREAGILIRPHPRTPEKHAGRFAYPEFDRVAVWPAGGANPVDTVSKDDYFDSLYHAAAVIGINTSAQIEAAIVGRPVFSIRVPQYADTQEGTLHFDYLLHESGGVLQIADTLDEHVRTLALALHAPGAAARRLEEFVRGFVRPHGLDVPATPLLADGIEALARMPKRAPRRLSSIHKAKRPFLPAVRQLFR
jgi:hypothetical protein